MLRSSLGFHTMTLSMPLFSNEEELITDFLKYRQKTKLIKMYSKKNNMSITYNPSKSYISIPPAGIQIYYSDGNYKGIEWNIRYSSDYGYGLHYMVDATINPKFLAGIHDYLTAATYSDMKLAIRRFNLESGRISSLLRTFDDYKITRVDYCANICLDEFVSGCDPELFMNLIRRSNVPHHYKERLVYDKTEHRMKSEPGSFYLINHSVNINYYSKYMQLQGRSKENIEKGFDPVPQETLDAARDIFRFEVQFKYPKINALSREIEKSGNHGRNKYIFLLTPTVCRNVISDYYKKVIGNGDWYTLHEAVDIIKSKHFNIQKEKRLIDALLLVNQCRSVVIAKAVYPNGTLADSFKLSLKELSDLGINPVTIPRSWNIKHIPNLIQAYFDKSLKEFISNL